MRISVLTIVSKTGTVAVYVCESEKYWKMLLDVLASMNMDEFGKWKITTHHIFPEK